MSIVQIDYKKYLKILVVAHWGFESLHGGNLRTFFIIKNLIVSEYEVTILVSNPSQINHTKYLFPKAKNHIYKFRFKTYR